MVAGGAGAAGNEGWQDNETLGSTQPQVDEERGGFDQIWQIYRVMMWHLHYTRGGLEFMTAGQGE